MDTEQSQKEKNKDATLKLPKIESKGNTQSMNTDLKNVTGSLSVGNEDGKIISSEFKLGENLNKNSSRGSLLSNSDKEVKIPTDKNQNSPKDKPSGTGHQNTSLNSGRASRFKKIDFVKLNMKSGKQ